MRRRRQAEVNQRSEQHHTGHGEDGNATRPGGRNGEMHKRLPYATTLTNVTTQRTMPISAETRPSGVGPTTGPCRAGSLVSNTAVPCRFTARRRLPVAAGSATVVNVTVGNSAMAAGGILHRGLQPRRRACSWIVATCAGPGISQVAGIASVPNKRRGCQIPGVPVARPDRPHPPHRPRPFRRTGNILLAEPPPSPPGRTRNSAGAPPERAGNAPAVLVGLNLTFRRLHRGRGRSDVSPSSRYPAHRSPRSSTAASGAAACGADPPGPTLDAETQPVSIVVGQLPSVGNTLRSRRRREPRDALELTSPATTRSTKTRCPTGASGRRPRPLRTGRPGLPWHVAGDVQEGPTFADPRILTHENAMNAREENGPTTGPSSVRHRMPAALRIPSSSL